MNGKRQQTGNLAQMIWSVGESITEIAKLVELAPGDIIFTGTPSGIGPVQCGDTLTAAIGGLGHLQVVVQ